MNFTNITMSYGIRLKEVFEDFLFLFYLFIVIFLYIIFNLMSWKSYEFNFVLIAYVSSNVCVC